MQTLNLLKEELKDIKRDVLRRANSLKEQENFDEIMLESVEENIALWRKYKSGSSKSYYFFTDLEGKLLFDGKTFQYATPFSDSKACLKYDKEWYVIDLVKKESKGNKEN